MSLTDLSMTSAMTSPVMYMPSQDEHNMAFYSQPQQQLQTQQLQPQQSYGELPLTHDQAPNGMIAYSPMAFSPMHMSYHQHHGQGSGTPDVEHQQQSQQQQGYRPM